MKLALERNQQQQEAQEASATVANSQTTALPDLQDPQDNLEHLARMEPLERQARTVKQERKRSWDTRPKMAVSHARLDPQDPLAKMEHLDSQGLMETPDSQETQERTDNQDPQDLRETQVVLDSLVNPVHQDNPVNPDNALLHLNLDQKDSLAHQDHLVSPAVPVKNHSLVSLDPQVLPDLQDNLVSQEAMVSLDRQEVSVFLERTPNTAPAHRVPA
jgi:hypothetical protein